jgi:hypothetical protein
LNDCATVVGVHLLLDGELAVPIRPARPDVVLGRAQQLVGRHEVSEIAGPDGSITIVNWRAVGRVQVVP